MEVTLIEKGHKREGQELEEEAGINVVSLREASPQHLLIQSTEVFKEHDFLL